MRHLYTRIKASLGPSASQTREAPGVMAWTLAVLFFVGATVGTLSLILPHPVSFDDFGLWTNIAIAYSGSIALALAGRRAPEWFIHLALLAGSVLITRAVLLSEEPGGFYAFWYIWVALYAFFFFGRIWGAVHTVIAAVLLAVALIEISGTGGTPAAYWLTTVTTMAVVGIFADVLLRRLRGLADESAARAARLAAVGDVAHEIARQTVSAATGPAICRATADVTGASSTALLEPTPDGGGLRVVASTDPSAAGRIILLAGPPSGAVKAFAGAEPVFHTPDESGPVPDPVLGAGSPESSALFQPILREGTPIGVLVVRWDAGLEQLSEGAADVVALLATEASIAITRAELLDRLEHAANTDDLTGVYNRRAWNEELAREVARSKRTGAPVTVALLDLDRFKGFNDRFGHQAGDRMLKRITAIWRERIRPTDVLARYGGDEFALALPDCPADGAEVLIDRLREALPEDETVSAGFATWNGRESPEELLARADAALYAAKLGGRDRVGS